MQSILRVATGNCDSESAPPPMPCVPSRCERSAQPAGGAGVGSPRQPAWCAGWLHEGPAFQQVPLPGQGQDLQHCARQGHHFQNCLPGSATPSFDFLCFCLCCVFAVVAVVVVFCCVFVVF